MAHIDMWNGSKWQRLNSNNVRMWNGSSWQRPKARIWNGHDWVECLEERHVDVFTTTGCQAYWSWGQAKGWNALVSPHRPTQGCYIPYHDWYDKGDERSMINFDDGYIRNVLSGARIEKVEVYLYMMHSMYYSGGEAVIGTHNARGWQSRYQEANFGVARARYYQRGQGQWIQLPNWVGDNFRDNLLSGLTVRAGDTSGYRYLWFAGSDDADWAKPKLRITYWK